MIFFILLVIIFSLLGSKPNKGEDPLSINSTMAVKGIFILLIFVTHCESYLTFDDSMMDKMFFLVRNALGQNLVTMFFFYSGYGIMESIKRKGDSYISSFPGKRFLKVLVHFDLAVLVFLVVGLLLGTEFELSQVLLSFTGYSSVGNSNWFIFDTLVLYVFTYVSFKLNKDHEKAVYGIMGLTLVFMVLMYIFKEPRWYNTVILFPLGMLFSLKRKEVEKRFANAKVFGLVLACLTVCFLGYCFAIRNIVFEQELVYLPVPLMFTAIMLMITYVWHFDNPVLQYYGRRLFELFIFMRIPMMLLKHFGVENHYIFVTVSFVAASVLVELFSRLFAWVDRRFF